MSERIPMTRAGYNKIRAELDRLQNEEMPIIEKRIATARSEGDLSENAEYHGARESQGLLLAKINLLRDKAESTGVEIRTEYANPALLVYGDARSLKQIFVNLLSNAVKFTRSGGQIVVGARIDYKGRFVATVADDGIGIAKPDQARIFQPFIQADSSVSRQYEGTGLGLPLTKSLVELHDGELDLKSKEGEGTTVKVILPKERVIGRKTAAAAE